MIFRRLSVAFILSAVLTLTSAFAQDYWSGPYSSCPGSPGGSNSCCSSPGNWSTGLPGPADDVVIYHSGGYDIVYLDTSPSINSLTLGGTHNGACEPGDFCSALVDNGTAQTLTIAKSLTVGQTGYLELYAGNTVTAGTDSSNAGIIELANGTTFRINGNFNNSFYFTLYSGGNHVQINGNLNNSNEFNSALNGGNTIGVTGTLTNSGQFYVQNGDTVSLGGLNNSNGLSVEAGGNLNIASGGVTDVIGGSSYYIAGKFTVAGR